MTLREDRIERPHPDGTPRPGLYAVVVKPHAAVVVPWDGTHLHLVGQHRYPLDQWSWEFPQGAHHPPELDGASSQEGGGQATAGGGSSEAAADSESDAPGPAEAEDHEAVAHAELREETGLTAGQMRRLGEMAFAPGMSDQRFTAWLATDLRPGPIAPDPEEEGMLRHRTATPDEFDALVRSGEVVDAATVATWHLARSLL